MATETESDFVRQNSKDKKQRRQDWITAISCIIQPYLTNNLYLNMNAIMPAFIDENYTDLKSSHVSCIMTAFAVGYMLVSPMAGSALEVHGRKKVMYLGILTCALGTAILGMASYLNNPWMFLVLSMIGQFLQGSGDVVINVAVPSILITEFPDQKDLYIGLYSMSLGLGMTTGPVLGIAVYSITDYKGTCYFFALLILIACGYLTYVLPNTMKKAEVQTNTNDCDITLFNNKEITYSYMLMNKRFLSTLFARIFGSSCQLFLWPILTIRLLHLGVSEFGVSIAFLIIGLSATIGGPVTSLMCKYFTHMQLIFTGMLMQGFACLLCGPTQFFGGLPNYTIFIYMGLWPLAWGFSMCHMPIIPSFVTAHRDQLMSTLTKRYQRQNGVLDAKSQNVITKTVDNAIPVICDKASSINMAAFGFAQIVGPMAGGIMYDNFGYRETCDIIATLIFFVCCIFWLLVMMPNSQNEQQLQDGQRSSKIEL